MSPATRSCPKCGTVLMMPDPLPERVGCPKCKAVLKIGGKPVASVPAVVLPPAERQTSYVVVPSAPSYAPQPQPQAVASPPMPLMAVAGHTLVRELARGGLGVVYLAHHDMIGDYRAIKRPLSDGGFDRDVLLARFRREVQAVGALRDEHIARTFDAGIDAHGPYLVMEHLDGMSLAGLVARHRKLPSAEACEMIRQAAMGLQGAYEAGLVHRDIKPSNLMLARTRNGARVVIIDWGLVKRAGEAASSASAGGLTGSGIGLGTPDYMAPEQVSEARTVDIRADIYSLGATLYSLLSGRVPYPDRSDLEKLLAHQKGDPFVPLSQLRPDVPQRLLAVLEKMTAKDPSQRFQTPAAVADAMAYFATGTNPGQLAALLGQETERPIPPPSGFNTWGVPASTQGVPAAIGQPTTTYQEIQVGKTILSTMPTSPKPAGGIPKGKMVVAAGVVLLLAVVVGGVWMMRGDGKRKEDPIAETKDKGTKDKNNEKQAGPRFLINEDFKDAFKIKRLPKGWTEGEGFRVVKDQAGQVCLELSTGGAIHWVKLIPVAISGDFVLECTCFVPYGSITSPYSAVTFKLEDRDKTTLIVVNVNSHGNLLIGTKQCTPPPNFIVDRPLKITIDREGTNLRVLLNDEVAATKDLDASGAIDEVTLGLTPTRRAGVGPRIYGIRVGNLGAEGGPMPMPEGTKGGGGKKGKR